MLMYPDVESTPTAQSLTPRVDETTPVKVTSKIVRPHVARHQTRLTCTPAELAAADAKRVAALRETYHEAYATAYELFEGRQITHDEFRGLVRAARATLMARI